MKIALIGKGYWGSKLERYLSQVFEVALWADSKTDLSEMWADQTIEGVVIATPMETHYRLAKQTLLEGKHVFIEKPVTLIANEAEELKMLAAMKGKKIGVDYTQTFSLSVLKACMMVKQIGEIQYIEMATKSLGRFMRQDVFWLLASHHLAVLDMFVDLEKLTFSRHERMYHERFCTTGTLEFEGPYLPSGRIDVSLNCPGKEMFFILYGEKGTLKYDVMVPNTLVVTIYNRKLKVLPDKLTEKVWRFSYDEKNNLRFSAGYFRELIGGRAESNLDMAIRVTRILDG